MRGALVIALCVTGCFSDRGVAIEIDISDTPDVASVELYIGKAACDSSEPGCSTITPPGAVCALRDHSWFLDAAQPSTAPVQGHKATLRLESDTTRTLPIVIAVGLDANGGAIATATLRDLEVPSDTGRIATTTLVPAKPVSFDKTDPRTLNEDRVTTWTNKQMPPGACVLVEHWRPGSEPVRDSVGPADDPECDDGMKPVNVAPSSVCAAVPEGAKACMLGIRACNVDGSIGGTCAPLNRQVCVPDQICTVGCTDLACIGTKLTTLLVPRIICTIQVGPDGVPCGGPAAQVNLDAELSHGCGHQPQIGTAPLGGFEDRGPLNNGITIQLGTTSSACRFPVSASGMLTADTDGHGLVRLDPKPADLLLPIQFKFLKLTECAGQLSTCMVLQDDSNKLWTCAE
jgi:hypothetical protein